jgi:hypothetical protein
MHSKTGKFRLDYIPTDQQPADALTKALGPQKHLHALQLMGFYNVGSRLQLQQLADHQNL